MFDQEGDFDEPAEDVPLVDPDVVEDPTTETPGPTLPVNARVEHLQEAVDDYYNTLANTGLTLELGRDPTKFQVDLNGRWQLKAFPDL